MRHQRNLLETASQISGRKVTKEKLSNAQSHRKTGVGTLCYVETCTKNNCLRFPRVACCSVRDVFINTILKWNWMLWVCSFLEDYVVIWTVMCVSVCAHGLFFLDHFLPLFLATLGRCLLKKYKSFDIFLVTEAVILWMKQWSETLAVTKYWILILSSWTERALLGIV